ncbi:olfactory receptor 151-like [Gopherus flavomarginatus]|uniref:olfactory receptor 151-like n=1 Tax=Gopherus flavomarginatus TaxID=286002 RepID=UPI0021CC162E|nr:olfactory receptor 151-like [Gopherus flavomarginatus]
MDIPRGTHENRNQTSITEFILLGFGNVPELQILLFLLFLVIYIMTMAGNILIAAIVVADHHLHTPVCFFLGNLSFLETCYTSTILPRMLASILTGDRTISVNGCFMQLYCFGVLACSECYLLAAMSYDRYLAIYINILQSMTKVFLVFYTILTPLVNPLIYSLRNKEMNHAEESGRGNLTTVTEFILLGLSNHHDLQVPLFFIYLVIYTITLMGNIRIILIG